jgi:general secretion pathway protein A
MYEPYFGLRERPFDLTPNPRYLFLTRGHREALINLQYGIQGSRGITLLIGDAGTGKTTLIQRALAPCAGQNSRHVYVNNPTLTRREFLERLAVSFQLSPEAAGSKTRLLMELQELLTSPSGSGLALIIDEAQSLPDELLEEVRLLANVETPTRKLPVVLAGQPELADRLNQTSLRQLKQRVALRCVLAPLTRRETAAYIARRIQIAGGEASACFTSDAIATVYERSGGIPRIVSVICDNALITGFAADERPVGRTTVLDVCRDFDFAPVAGTSAAPGSRNENRTEQSAMLVGATQAASTPGGAGESTASRAAELFSQFSRPTRTPRFLFF